MKNTYLQVKWTVSRGRDTYGYNICTVTDRNTDKHFRCNGGGYDMLGTSFANWLEYTYQERLQALNAETGLEGEGDYKHNKTYYGLSEYKGNARLDGACGLSSMLRVAMAIGLDVDQLYGRNETTGFYVIDTRSD